MKRTSIVFALILLITFAMFSGCISQKKENGVDVNTTPVQTGKTVSYLKARVTISQPYDLSDLNSSRQKVVIIRDYGTKLIAEVTLYGEEYYVDEYATLPYLQTEKDANATLKKLPKDVLPYVLPTDTVEWDDYMREKVAKLYAKDANYSIVGTAYLIMKDQKQVIVLDESPYQKEGYQYWWLQPASYTISAESHKAMGYGPYATLYAALMRF